MLSPTLSHLGLLRTTSLGYLTNSNTRNTSGYYPPLPTCSPSSLTAGGVFRCAGGIIPNQLISLCYPVVWLVVDYAPTRPRRATFWGDTGANRIVAPDYFPARAPICYPAGCTACLSGFVACERLATASPMGKYICDAVGRARDTPPVPVLVCNLAIFFVFLGV